MSPLALVFTIYLIGFLATGIWLDYKLKGVDDPNQVAKMEEGQYTAIKRVLQSFDDMGLSRWMVVVLTCVLWPFAWVGALLLGRDKEK